MTYEPTMAEAQAIGLCSLARQKGLPAIAILRTAVVQLHPETCGWCDYPLEDLDRILRDFNRTRTRFEDERWQALPAKAKRAAIELAQDRAAA